MQSRIKQLREEHEMSQADVAAAIGITQRKYSYIETQTQPLYDEVLCKLSRLYHVSIDYILMLTDEK